MPTIGVAIPCYHGHVKHLALLLDNIEKQIRKPDMVVVSCSGVDYDIHYEHSYPLQIITTPYKQNSSQNRNIAASKLETDIITFIDADDLMHFQRLAIIEKAFVENNIVILLHNFIVGFDTLDITYDNIMFDINTLIVIDEYVIQHIKTPSNIHNGHCSIDRKLLTHVRYNESPTHYGKEDSVFNADIIRMFPTRNAYCPLVLSKYVPSDTLSFAD